MRGLAQLVHAGTHVAGGIADASDALVLVPASRAKRALERHLLACARDSGCALLTPTIVTPGALASCVVVPTGRVLGVLGARLAWRRALVDAPAGIRAAIAGRSAPDFGAVGDADAMDLDLLSLRIAALHREAASACLTLGEIAQAREGSASAHDAKRWDALRELERAWEESLSQTGTVDLAVAAREACRRDALRLGTVRRAFVLLADPEPLHREILRSLARVGVPVTVVVHATDHELAAPLDPDGFPEHAAWARASIEVPDDAIVRAGGPASQAAGILDAICSIPEPRRSPDLAVSIPQREVEAEAVALLTTCGMRVNASPQRTAADAPLGSLLRAVGAFLRDRTCAHLSALVRHPSMERRLLAAGCERPVASVASFAATSGVDELPEAIVQPVWSGAQAVLACVDRWLRPVRDARGGEAILAALRRALEEVADDASAPGHEAARAFRRSADEFRGVPEPLLTNLDASTLVRYMAELMAASQLATSGDADGIDLMGWLDVGVDDAPDVVLACMNDGVVPEGVRTCPWLTDSVRERHGLPCARRRQARDAWILHSLLARKRTVRFIVGRTNGRGEPIPPSRLLLRMDGARLARRLAWLTAESAPLADSTRWRQPVRPAGTFVVDPLPVAAGTFTSIRVTAFRDYLESPTLFRLRHDPRIALCAAGAAEGEMDPRSFGNVIHAVLQEWGREEADADRPTTDERTIAARVLEALRAYRIAHFPSSIQAAYEVQFALAQERLVAFARVQAARAREGWRVRHAELAFTPSPGRGLAHVVPAPTIGTAGIVLTGRIDRVDVDRDGHFVALDYKTSATATAPKTAHRRRDGGWKDLQLPLYAYLLGSMSTPIRVAADSLGYFSLPSNPARTTIAMTKEWGDTDLADAIETAAEIADAVAAGSFPHDAGWKPDADDDLAPVFGVGLRLDGDAEGDADEDEEAAP